MEDFEKQQVNGQRRIRRVSASSSDGEGHEIFIQNLPNDCFEEELLPLLVRFGEISELRIMMNFSGLTRGFAYARYANQTSAEEAVGSLNKFEIRPDVRISVQHSLDKKKIYFGNLPASMNRDDLDVLLKSLTENIEEIEFFRQSAYVTYRTHTDAAAARRVLIPNRREIFSGESVVIEWARQKKRFVKCRSSSAAPKLPYVSIATAGRPLRKTQDHGPSFPIRPPSVHNFPPGNPGQVGMQRRMSTGTHQHWVQNYAWSTPPPSPHPGPIPGPYLGSESCRPHCPPPFTSVLWMPELFDLNCSLV